MKQIIKGSFGQAAGIAFVTLVVGSTFAAADPYPKGSAARESADHIKEIAAPVVEGNGRDFHVTSEQRDNSAAHQRGAVDYRSNNTSEETRQAEAKQVSQALGSDHTVVVEDVHRPERGAEGPSAQVNTAYRDGNEGKTRVLEDKATATHTHVQPEVAPSHDHDAGNREHEHHDAPAHDRPGEFHGRDIDTLDRMSRTG